ncbi:DUF6985 domain-containing protein [Cytobacillus sp. FJAT-53684]|uniref:DUF6985 domain-containing protein n=1 Tax=Cytobacillus mangrovibacter TaxID=3299024 RepID=A0ABW6K4N2_9BACI
MKNQVFGELIFDTGWKAKTVLVLFDKTVDIMVKAKAYYEKDGITSDQEKAFADWDSNKEQKVSIIEKLLNDYCKSNAPEQFIPRTLLFDRNGEYALLLDDKCDQDEGIAICLVPNERVVLQGDYL